MILFMLTFVVECNDGMITVTLQWIIVITKAVLVEVLLAYVSFIFNVGSIVFNHF